MLSASVTPATRRLNGKPAQRPSRGERSVRALGRIHRRALQPRRRQSTARRSTRRSPRRRTPSGGLRLTQWRRFGRARRARRNGRPHDRHGHAERAHRAASSRTLNEWRASAASAISSSTRATPRCWRRRCWRSSRAVVLGWRSLRGRLPGRTAIALPAILPRIRRSPLVVRAARAVRAVSRGAAVLLPGAGRSAFVAVGAPGVVSGPADRRHHGCVAEHAVAVQRPAAQDRRATPPSRTRWRRRSTSSACG